VAGRTLGRVGLVRVEELHPVGKRCTDAVIVFHQPRQVAERVLEHLRHVDLGRWGQRVSACEIGVHDRLVNQVLVQFPRW
jgi:hypothetical protein